MEYVRKTTVYRQKRGGRVRCVAFDGWCDGTITSASHYVIVRPDPWPNARLRYHPTNSEHLVYVESSKEVRS